MNIFYRLLNLISLSIFLTSTKPAMSAQISFGAGEWNSCAKIFLPQESSDTPVDILYGREADMQISGLPPGESVVIRASAGEWNSFAEFKTLGDGSVNLASQKPIRGTYKNADANGLFWSMKTNGNVPAPPSLETTISVELNGNVVGRRILRRTFEDKSIRSIPVTDNGLVGNLQLPQGDGPFPVLILVGGSEGGLSIAGSAPYFASHGFAVLSLAWWNAGTLPKSMSKVPLEYFEKAIAWLKTRSEIDSKRIAISGTSRGGELALVVASIFPEIKAVISATGIPLIVGDSQLPESSSWTYHGQQLPFLPTAGIHPSVTHSKDGPVLSFKNVINTALAINHPTIAAASMIPVERIRGPILMLAGEDDQSWPSADLYRAALHRLKAFKRQYHDKLVVYPNVGHAGIGLPGLPTTQSAATKHPTFNYILATGGTPEDNAKAQIASTREMVHFLKENLMR